MRFLELLTIVFVVLKSTGHIDWSWGVVFIPMYISLAIYVGVILCVLRLPQTITNFDGSKFC